MTDRELLELAAEAAGLAWEWNACAGGIQHIPKGLSFYVDWNPLTDDGDALRLAVKLQIQVTPGTYNKYEFTAYNSARHVEAHERYHYQQNECAATRRCIVRAAAAIANAK